MTARRSAPSVANALTVTKTTGTNAVSCDAGIYGLTADTAQTGGTLVVNTTSDTNDGICGVLHCSLREAIAAANADGIATTINFNIPGPAPHVITLSSHLPSITQAVTINGLSQPEISGGNCPIGSPTNDDLAIQLDDPGNLLYALLVNSSGGGSSIRGLSFTRFGDGGAIQLQASGSITCNYIGVAADGTTSGGNEIGVITTSTSNVTIGGPSGDGNVIANNAQQGIYVSGGTTNSTVRGNVIRNNGLDGIVTQGGTVTGVRFTENAIYANGQEGIDLNNNGVTPNDTNDADGGHNNLQNFPVITGAVTNGTITAVNFTLDSNPGNYTVEFFSNPACDGTNGEGQVYLGRTTVTLPGGPFSVTTLPATTVGHVITATAIKEGGTGGAVGDTSEFSACLMITPLLPPTLGNYPATNVGLNGNTTVTPDAAPTGVNYVTATTTSGFKGTLAVNPSTGVVRVTNAHPAGVFPVKVKAFGPDSTQTTTFNLTVSGGTLCAGQTIFTSAPNTGTSNTNYAVAVADFNNDGKQDAAIADSQNTVAIRLGNGNGTFTNMPNVAVAATPIAVIAITVGDFNGDGNQDFATANNQGDSIAVRLGNGAGGFTSAPDLSFGNSPLSIATGDFNGDGNLDLVATKVSSPVAAIFLGNGLGGFTLSSQVTVSFYPESIVVGDFNSDGKLDVATANRFGSNVSVRFGDGSGNLSGTTDIIVGTFPRSLAIGDFNGDGKQDLVTANNATSNSSILIGDGTGGFTPQTPVNIGSQPRGVAVGDFNADGKDDFVVTRSGGSASLRLGDGTGSFTALPDISTGTQPEGLAIGDFNGDGRQDFIFANYVVPAYASIRLGGCLPPTTTIVTSSANPSVFGQAVTLTATVTPNPNTGTPTGTVQFFDTGNPITGCTSVTLSGGQAQCTTSALSVDSSHTITASYSGDSNFSPSTGSLNMNPQVVNKADTTVTITNAAALSNTPTVDGQSYAVQWSVAVNSPGAGTLTGNVTVSDGTDSCTAAVSPGSCNLTSTTTGSKTITVTYEGDSNFNGDNETATHQVNPACTSNPVVTNTADSGAGSLRQAVIDACPGSTITFDTAGVFSTPQTITLTTGEIVIGKNLTINGPGANQLTVSGNNASSVFNISSGTVTLDRLTIANGSNLQGGGISNAGSLTLTNSTLSSNSAIGPNSQGGAIFNNGTVSVTNSILSGNTVGGGTTNFGGGIHNNGTLTLTNSTLSGNSVGGGGSNFGGGIYISGGKVTITDSTISGNSASGGGGSDFGGGIYNSGTLTVTNSTLSGNFVSSSSSSTTNFGGGIFSDGTLTLTNSTLSGNSASGSDNRGGGILNLGGTANARNTIIAGNTASTSGPDVFGNFISQGHNLIGKSDNSTGFTNGTNNDQVGTIASPLDPKLGSLGNTGGQTQTMALLPGSPAINAGDDCVLDNTCSPALGFNLTTDQRGTGFDRKVGTYVDIGAFEANYSISVTAGDPQSATINTQFATNLQATVKESGNTRTGLSVTFTAPASGASGTFQTSGINTVTVTTDANGIATAPAFTANSAAGSYVVTASLADGTTSADLSLTNAKADQTILFGALPDQTFGDADFNLSATASSGLPVSFTASGNCTVTGNTVHLTGGGSCTVRASQAGSSDYNAAPDVDRPFNIAKATTTTTITVNDAVYNGNPHGGTASVTGAGGLNQSLTVTYTGRNSTAYGPTTTAPTHVGEYTASATFAGDSSYQSSSDNKDFQITKANQTITFNALANKTYGDADFIVSASASSGLAVSFSATGNCTVTGSTVHITGAGSCTISASQGGNSNYNPAPNVDQTFQIAKASQTIAFNALPDKTYGDADFMVSATVSSGLAVSFTATGACTVSGNTVHLTGASSCTITASQAGDSNYDPAANIDRTFNVAKAASTTTVTASNAVYDGDPHGGIASVTGAGGLNQSLTVTYTGRNATTYGPSTTAPTSAGDYTASATFAGDADHTGSAGSRDFSTTKANQTITFSTLSNKTFGDADFQLGGTASSGLAVSFAASGQCTISGSTVHLTAAGSCTITASQAGNSNYTAAASVQQSFQIAKADQTITFNTLADKSFGEADFIVSATSSSGLSVSFSATGQCTVTGNIVHLTGVGSCTITASQAGGSNYNAATSIQRSFNITTASTSTAVTSSLNPSELGQSVTFTATVSSTAGTPTGTVQFKHGSANLGSAVTLNSGGVATFSTSALTVGTQTITAVYSGDSNFSTSSGTLSGGQVVTANPGLSISDVSVVEGNSGTTQAVLTLTLAQASSLTVKVDYATADGTATSGSDYQSTTGTLTFNPGDQTKTITVLVNGDTVNEADETFYINLSNPQNSTLSDNQGQGTILNEDAPVAQFSASTYSANENGGHATVTVTRTGDASQAMTVDYTTSDQAGLTLCSVANSLASQRCDYAMSVGTLRFAGGETSKTIFIPIVDDSYTEGSETFAITLSHPTGTSLGTQSSATVTINDNDASNGSNPIVNADFLIRQLYMDFLGREPEPQGLQGWLNILNNCGVSVQRPCDRTEVASDFYRSDEFQMRGFFIYRTYTTLGRIPHYGEFMPDFAKVSGFLTDAELEANKAGFIQEFMQRAEFKTKYDPTLNNPTAYVDLLLQTTGLQNHPQRAAWTTGLTNQTLTRGQVLLALIDSAEVYAKYYNEAFVVEMYFGFLRRDPDILCQQWIQTLNQTNDYRTLVSGFLNSNEYVQRFGP